MVRPLDAEAGSGFEAWLRSSLSAWLRPSLARSCSSDKSSNLAVPLLSHLEKRDDNNTAEGVANIK